MWTKAIFLIKYERVCLECVMIMLNEQVIGILFWMSCRSGIYRPWRKLSCIRETDEDEYDVLTSDLEFNTVVTLNPNKQVPSTYKDGLKHRRSYHKPWIQKLGKWRISLKVLPPLYRDLYFTLSPPYTGEFCRPGGSL